MCVHVRMCVSKLMDLWRPVSCLSVPLRGWPGPLGSWLGPLGGWLGPLGGWLGPLGGWLGPLRGWLGLLGGWLGLLRHLLGRPRYWLRHLRDRLPASQAGQGLSEPVFGLAMVRLEFRWLCK